MDRNGIQLCTGRKWILLRHSQFNESGGAANYKECNNGDIMARSMPVVEDNCYSSKLSVRASSALNGRTIRYVGMRTIGNATMTIISGMLHNSAHGQYNNLLLL